MTTLTFTTTQSWTAPADCRGIDTVDSTAGGGNGTNGDVGGSINSGNGGAGGGAGSRAIKHNIPCTPGEVFTVYAGPVGGQSGLFSASRGWLCLALGASNSVGGQPSIYDSGWTGPNGTPGDVGTQNLGGNGGNGASSVAYPDGGVGGRGGTFDFRPGNVGANANNYGGGGGGGGGGYVLGNTGGGGGAGYQGITTLTYTPYIPHPPTITGLSIHEGSPGGGQTVVITGTNLSNVTSVVFGAVNANSFTIDSGTQITTISPQHTAGVFDVRVTNVDGQSAVSSNDLFTFKAKGGFNLPMLGM